MLIKYANDTTNIPQYINNILDRFSSNDTPGLVMDMLFRLVEILTDKDVLNKDEFQYVIQDYSSIELVNETIDETL